MLRLLQVVIALGGASYAWSAYSAVYERHRATSESPDRVIEKWWRILSQAIAVLLLSFVFVVAAAAVRAPRWLALLLFGLLAASLLVAIALVEAECCAPAGTSYRSRTLRPVGESPAA